MKKLFFKLTAALFVLILIEIGRINAQSPDPKLVAHWHMDEGSGTTVYDASGKGHHGTITGSSTEWDWVEGIQGNALYFNGSVPGPYGFPWASFPYILISYDPDFVFGTGSFTLEVWAKLKEILNQGYGEIILGTNWNAARAVVIGFGIDPYNYQLPKFQVLSGSGNEIMGQEKAEFNKWYHLVGVRNTDIDKIQIYVNGELAGEKEDISGSLPSTHWSISGQYTWVGKVHGCFHGIIDEVAIYRRVLTAQEILEHYQQFTNRPPIANAGPDQTVECTSCCATEVTLDGTESTDPDGDPLTYHWTWNGNETTGSTSTITLPLGTTTVFLVVNDGKVDSEPSSVDITITDSTPPEINVSVIPEELWPPNHRMVDIAVNVMVNDVCDPEPSWKLLSITCNEDPGKKHSPDIMGQELETPDVEFQLRATRLGVGEGRIYVITYEATDVSGNSATADDTVWVPHSQGKLKKVNAFANVEIKPESFELFQNNPNPFNSETTISYALPEPSHVSLVIYNVAGAKILTLIDSEENAGYHYLTWDGKDCQSREVSAGIYICRIKAGTYQKTIQILLLK